MIGSHRIGELVLAGDLLGVVLADVPGGDLIVAPLVEESGGRIIEVFPEDLQKGELFAPSNFDVASIRSISRDISQRQGLLKKAKTEEFLKAWGRILSTSYYEGVLADKSAFEPGRSRVAYAGRVFDQSEIATLVESALDFWLTAGPYAQKFEKGLADYLGVAHCSIVNSGSSANLLAFAALTSPKLGERRIVPGDEVITVAAAFPTTVSPIVQFGAVPVFVDVTLPSYNIDSSQLEGALSPRSKAVFLAHTLGNPFDLERVRDFCDRHSLWLIEDNCDALGSRYFFRGAWRYTGTIGDLATSSFYPPHHITLGEGGAVYTDNTLLKGLVESFRDWGRDCWCPSGQDNTCENRFSRQFGELPIGYDHKYVYSHFGYNLKATDLQAAIGCVQLDKLPGFIEARKRNWQFLRDELADMEDYFILPEAQGKSDPSWFGFLLTVRRSAPFSRDDMVQFLERSKIQTRMLFAGNLLRHPCFDEMRLQKRGYRVVGDLRNTDTIMRRTFWVGVYPGMTDAMIDYMIKKIRAAVGRGNM